GGTRGEGGPRGGGGVGGDRAWPGVRARRGGRVGGAGRWRDVARRAALPSTGVDVPRRHLYPRATRVRGYRAHRCLTGGRGRGPPARALRGAVPPGGGAYPGWPGGA